jgi:hypothetical protein
MKSPRKSCKGKFYAFRDEYGVAVAIGDHYETRIKRVRSYAKWLLKAADWMEWKRARLKKGIDR